MESATAAVAQVAGWVRLALEAAGVMVIAVGGAVALATLVGSRLSRGHVSFNATRLTMARYLTLALEFQLAGDILQTAIAPEWPEIGQLAAIATIRTALNFFLSREMREERTRLQADNGLDASTRVDARTNRDH